MSTESFVIVILFRIYKFPYGLFLCFVRLVLIAELVKCPAKCFKEKLFPIELIICGNSVRDK